MKTNFIGWKLSAFFCVLLYSAHVFSLPPVQASAAGVEFRPGGQSVFLLPDQDAESIQRQVFGVVNEGLFTVVAAYATRSMFAADQRRAAFFALMMVMHFQGLTQSALATMYREWRKLQRWYCYPKEGVMPVYIEQPWLANRFFMRLHLSGTEPATLEIQKLQAEVDRNPIADSEYSRWQMLSEAMSAVDARKIAFSIRQEHNRKRLQVISDSHYFQEPVNIDLGESTGNALWDLEHFAHWCQDTELNHLHSVFHPDVLQTVANAMLVPGNTEHQFSQPLPSKAALTGISGGTSILDIQGNDRKRAYWLLKSDEISYSGQPGFLWLADSQRPLTELQMISGKTDLEMLVSQLSCQVLWTESDIRSALLPLKGMIMSGVSDLFELASDAVSTYEKYTPLAATGKLLASNNPITQSPTSLTELMTMRGAVPAWMSEFNRAVPVFMLGRQHIAIPLNLYTIYQQLDMVEIDYSKWKSLGAMLGLRDADLLYIEADNSEEETRFYEVIDHWLKAASNQNWATLLQAFHDTGAREVASNIRQNLDKSETYNGLEFAFPRGTRALTDLDLFDMSSNLHPVSSRSLALAIRLGVAPARRSEIKTATADGKLQIVLEEFVKGNTLVQSHDWQTLLKALYRIGEERLANTIYEEVKDNPMYRLPEARDAGISKSKRACLSPGCTQPFSRDHDQDLRKHQISYGGKWSCSHPGCTRSFSSAQSLREHEASHEGAWACSHPGCTRSYSILRNLREHQTSHQEKQDDVMLSIKDKDKVVEILKPVASRARNVFAALRLPEHVITEHEYMHRGDCMGLIEALATAWLDGQGQTLWRKASEKTRLISSSGVPSLKMLEYAIKERCGGNNVAYSEKVFSKWRLPDH